MERNPGVGQISHPARVQRGSRCGAGGSGPDQTGLLEPLRQRVARHAGGWNADRWDGAVADWLRISFRDTGSGLDPQQRTKIFEPLQSELCGRHGAGAGDRVPDRASAQRTDLGDRRKGPRRGIHGGTSAGGVRPMQATKSAAKEAGREMVHILVVDDERPSANCWRSLSARKATAWRWPTAGRPPGASLKARIYDMIISDIRMPDASGRRTSALTRKEVRARPLFRADHRGADAGNGDRRGECRRRPVCDQGPRPGGPVARARCAQVAENLR